MKAMIFAAGLGTRLKPFTDTMPKALVPVSGKPLLEHVILKLKSAGFDEVVINVHHFADQIIRFVEENDYFGIHIVFSDERDLLLDTGGGIKKARFFLDGNEPFLVHNVDILSNVDLKELYQAHSLSDLATMVVSERSTSRYLLFDEGNKLHGWTNISTNEIKPKDLTDISELKRLAYSGIQVISPAIFKLMDNYAEKFSIIDFYMDNVKSSAIKGYEPQNLKMLDVGKVDVLDKAEQFILEL